MELPAPWVWCAFQFKDSARTETSKKSWPRLAKRSIGTTVVSYRYST